MQNPYAAPEAEEAPPVLRFQTTGFGGVALGGAAVFGCAELLVGLGAAFLIPESPAWVTELGQNLLEFGAMFSLVALGLSVLGVVPFLHAHAKNAYALGLTERAPTSAHFLVSLLFPVGSFSPATTSRELMKAFETEERYHVALLLWWPLFWIAVAFHVLAVISWFEPCLIAGSICGVISSVFAFSVFRDIERSVLARVRGEPQA
ncbi:MAG: DUF4328 domain-containing protein [Myxococcales bacterium]|nr:DUF4328 domain-containing protein [Myxococcales bacterium]MCB9607165.1 DUF4328 domain-containing protein [Polyangiaceae bacterium]